MAAAEQHDIGVAEIEEADVVADWARPSFDVGSSTMGVFDGDRLGLARAMLADAFDNAREAGAERSAQHGLHQLWPGEAPRPRAVPPPLVIAC